MVICYCSHNLPMLTDSRNMEGFSAGTQGREEQADRGTIIRVLAGLLSTDTDLVL